MGNLLAASAASTSFFGVPKEVDAAIEKSNRERENYLKTQQEATKQQQTKILREGYQAGHDPAQILSWLYLGDRFSVRNPTWLKQQKIKYVLHVSNVTTSDALNTVLEAADVKYLRLPAEDIETENIILIFNQAVEFIEQGRSDQENKEDRFGVLVFCDEGVSRSPTIVMAYLLCRGWMLKGSIEHVKGLWPKAAPNEGFFNQLLEFEKLNFKDNSLQASDYSRVF